MCKRLEYLIIHCSGTPAKMEVTGADIRRWHAARGWKQVGYSDLIRRDGTIERLVEYDEDDFVSDSEITNGAKGYNGVSRHVCLAGGCDNNMQPQDNFTREQKESLVAYIKQFLSLHPTCRVIGHNEIAQKACPSFNVQQFLIENGIFVQ